MNATPFNQHTHGGHTAYPDDHTFILAQPLIIRTAPEWTALTDPPQTLPAGSLVHYTNHIRTKMHSYIKLTTGYLPTADLRTHLQYGADSDPTTSLVPAIEPVLGHRYPLKGQFRLTQQRLDEHTAPSLTAPVLRTFKQGATIPYTAKLRTRHYGWLEVPHAAGNGYLPFFCDTSPALQRTTDAKKPAQKLSPDSSSRGRMTIMTASAVTKTRVYLYVPPLKNAAILSISLLKSPSCATGRCFDWPHQRYPL